MTNRKGMEYRKKEDLKRFFYPEEWMTFYDSSTIKLRFYFNFLMQTGARYQELKHVEVRDIDFKRSTILIRYAKTRVGGLVKLKILCSSCNNKINVSKSLRFCPLCGTELPNLDTMKETYKKKITNRRRELRKAKVSSVFTAQLKQFITEHNLKANDTFKFPTIQHLNHNIKKTMKKNNVSDWQDFSPHSIRKTHENYLLATGSNVLSLGKHMGHSIDVASGHYISANTFTSEEIGMIKIIIGNLKI